MMVTSIWMKRLAWLGYFYLLVPYAQAQYVSDFSLPAPNLKRAEKRELWATWYNLAPAKEDPNGAPLVDTNNQPISVPIPPKQWCMGAMSGAIQVTDRHGEKQTYHYIDSRGPQRINCRNHVKIRHPWVGAIGRSRFVRSIHPYGDGFNKSVLIPYRTIAADKTKLPLGSVVFIPLARGVKIKLPDGNMAVHDGYFYVGDKGGGGVKDDHIDVFSGPIQENPFPAFIQRSGEDKHFDAYLIKEKTINERLVAMHQSPSSLNALSVVQALPRRSKIASKAGRSREVGRVAVIRENEHSVRLGQRAPFVCGGSAQFSRQREELLSLPLSAFPNSLAVCDGRLG